MKKILNMIGICLLTAFSFYYTNKMVELSKSKDPIMVEINNSKENFVFNAIDAVISNNYIIPGLNGIKVDVESSYYKMKELGEYNANLYTFISEMPKISIKDNYDKFIINGNKNKKEIVIVFKVNETINIDNLLKILKSNNTIVNFFIDGKVYENNIDELIKIKSYDHFIGNLGYDKEYNKNTIKYTNSIIDRVSKQKNHFCYVETDNLEVLRICSNLRMYTIKSTVISNINGYSDIKDKLQNGGIYTLDINSYTIKNLNTIINYIKQKGYKIVNIENIINEEY